MLSRLKPLWRCPLCGERFITRNMWHSCGKYSLEALFARCEPHVFPLFRKFHKMVRACGPVHVIPQKTRICFQVRVRFGGCVPRKSHLRCTLAFTRRVHHPRFVKIEKYVPHWYGHSFRVESENELDADVRRWIREAYKVGQQRRLLEDAEKPFRLRRPPLP